jgi:uncharacterized protein YciI
MKQYLIIAYDDTDEQAPERRAEVRPEHLAGAKELKVNNHFITGGAILDDNGRMKGSAMILQFNTEEEFDHWYAHEPYITKGVWKHIEVKPFRVADL